MGQERGDRSVWRRAGLVIIATLSVSLLAGCSTAFLDGDDSATPSPEAAATPTSVSLLRIVTPTPVTPGVTPTGPASPGATQNPETYIVAEGDSLYAIALQFDVELDALIQVNGLSDPNDIQVGQELKIPPRAQ